MLSKNSTGNAVRCVRFADRTTSSTPRSPILSARLIALLINLKLKARAGSGVHSPPALKYKPVRISRKNALITVIHLPKKVFNLGVRKERATGKPYGKFSGSLSSPILPTIKRHSSTRHYETGSGRNGYVAVIDFRRLGFSLSETDFVFHTQHKSSVQIPVFLDP